MSSVMTLVRRRSAAGTRARIAGSAAPFVAGLAVVLSIALPSLASAQTSAPQPNGVQANGTQANSPHPNGRSSEGEAFVGDVPYVPTPQDVVDTMLNMAQIGPDDYLIDLGSGDGRIVVTAASRFGAEGFGVDLDPKRIAEALENAKKAGVADRAAFFQRDLFETDFSRATVLSMYLLPDINMALRPKVLGLKPGTRVVSHDFDMGDWRPDHRVTMTSDITGYESNVYFWVVPAKVGGAWRWTAAGESLSLQVGQRFQDLELKLSGGKTPWQATDAGLRGDLLTFAARRADGTARIYTGRVSGDSITGTVRDGAGEKPWKAQRAR